MSGYVARKIAWIPLEERRAIYARDGRRCLACGSKVRLTLDHVKPRNAGGSSRSNNLLTLCARCNRKKATRSIADWRPHLLVIAQRQTKRRLKKPMKPVKKCGICGGSGGKQAGPDHEPGCYRYIKVERRREAPTVREPKPSSTLPGIGTDYCPHCRGPHVYKHGRP